MMSQRVPSSSSATWRGWIPSPPKALSSGKDLAVERRSSVEGKVSSDAIWDSPPFVAQSSRKALSLRVSSSSCVQTSTRGLARFLHATLRSPSPSTPCPRRALGAGSFIQRNTLVGSSLTALPAQASYARALLATARFSMQCARCRMAWLCLTRESLEMCSSPSRQMIFQSVHTFSSETRGETLIRGSLLRRAISSSSLA